MRDDLIHEFLSAGGARLIDGPGHFGSAILDLKRRSPVVCEEVCRASHMAHGPASLNRAFVFARR